MWAPGPDETSLTPQNRAVKINERLGTFADMFAKREFNIFFQEELQTPEQKAKKFQSQFKSSFINDNYQNNIFSKQNEQGIYNIALEHFKTKKNPSFGAMLLNTIWHVLGIRIDSVNENKERHKQDVQKLIDSSLKITMDSLESDISNATAENVDKKLLRDAALIDAVQAARDPKHSSPPSLGKLCMDVELQQDFGTAKEQEGIIAGVDSSSTKDANKPWSIIFPKKPAGPLFSIKETSQVPQSTRASSISENQPPNRPPPLPPSNQKRYRKKDKNTKGAGILNN
jgi:uncharacterized protein YfeS